MNAVAIIQARMTSTRLPGKVMMPLGGVPILKRVVERVALAQSVAQIVVATTQNLIDEAIAAFCAENGISCFRGDEADVLSRYAGASNSFGGDPVVRVTSDCPLIDPRLIDQAVALHAGTSSTYTSTMLKLCFPYGMAVEVFTSAMLAEADSLARDPLEREHVTLYMYRRPERYSLLAIETGGDYSHYRCTVDTPEDYELVTKVYASVSKLGNDYSWRDVVAAIDANPEWADINRHVQQVKVS